MATVMINGDRAHSAQSHSEQSHREQSHREWSCAQIEALRLRLRKTLRGKEAACDLALACLLARGHLLIEDPPGLGKTTLAKGLAALVGGRFARIQCTPDLLPTDVTGFTLYNQQSRQFEFRSGPVFADVLLADEINRATPRTQSALLEAMAERQVTIDDECHRLGRGFFVVATQNPLEHLGTYPLPEAQLDRFAMRLSIGAPDRATELALLEAARFPDAQDDAPEAVIDLPALERLQETTAELLVSDAVAGYLVDVGRTCRELQGGTGGPSPRGLLIWQRVAQAWAVIQGRDHVIPDDVRYVAGPVLGVRLDLAPAESDRLVADALDRVAVPLGAASH
jgi:MoxR-like ATPase